MQSMQKAFSSFPVEEKITSFSLPSERNTSSLVYFSARVRISGIFRVNPASQTSPSSDRLLATSALSNLTGCEMEISSPSPAGKSKRGISLLCSPSGQDQRMSIPVIVFFFINIPKYFCHSHIPLVNSSTLSYFFEFTVCTP